MKRVIIDKCPEVRLAGATFVASAAPLVSYRFPYSSGGSSGGGKSGIKSGSGGGDGGGGSMSNSESPLHYYS